MATMTLALDLALTYEAYLVEPQVEGRYDIVHGARVSQPETSWRRQRIVGNLAEAFFGYKRTSSTHAVPAPFDLLIRRVPLQIRQPDMLLISHDRLMQNGGPPKYGPLEVGPELVVEIVMDGEMERILGDKLADYIEIGVEECWVVRPDAGTVEVLTLAADGARSVAVYGDRESVVSAALPGLTAAVADVFAA